VDFAGDRMGGTYLLRIFDPDGNVFVEIRKRLKKDTQARFDLIDRKTTKRPIWPTTNHRGEFVLYRENVEK
jgi:hypothetical protein